MEKLESKSELHKLIEDVFSFEVDKRDAITYRGKRLQTDFWKNFYIIRKEEDYIFNSFLNSNNTLLFITGHLGTGKTTFIYDKYKNKKLFSGIIIDIKTIDIKTIDIKKDDDNSLVFLKYKNWIEKHLVEKYIEFFENYFLYNNTDKKQNNSTNVPANAHEKLLARKILALYTLYFIVNDDLNRIRKSHYFDVELEFDKFKDNNNKTLDDTLCDEIIHILNYSDCILLFRIIENKQNDYEDHLIVLDNIDAIDLTKVNQFFTTAIIDIINIFNDNYHNSPTKGYPRLKMILAVRDENICRLYPQCGGADRSQQITMGDKDYRIGQIQKIDQLMIDDRFVSQVILSRLIFIENINEMYGNEEDKKIFALFKNIIDNYWMDNMDNILHAGIDHINIRELCNDSLRQLLDLIIDSSFILIGVIANDEIDCEQNVSDKLKVNKGVIIHSLWSSLSTEKIMEYFDDSLSRELSTDYCCIARLILNYIYNKGKEVKISIIVNIFSRVFGYKARDITRCIFQLYYSKFNIAQLLTIYQAKLINKPSDIKLREATIRINGKGRIFMEDILINIDLFGKHLVSHPNIVYNLKTIAKSHKYSRYFKPFKDIDFIEEKRLYEMLPSEAYRYIIYIFFLIKTISDNNISFWKNTVSLNIDKLKIKGSNFIYYKDNFLCGNDFHIQRVCNSHRNNIKTYLSKIFTNHGSALFLNQSRREILEREIDYNVFQYSSIDKFDDTELNSFINSSFDSTSDICKIWELYNDYKKIYDKYKQFKKINNKNNAILRVSKRIN